MPDTIRFAKQGPDAAVAPAAAPASVVSAPIPSEPDVAPVPVEEPQVILIHILEDGFSAHGQIWYRGQEIEYVTDEVVYKDTMDRFGDSWLALDDRGQMQRYGRIYFRHGPWPGQPYADDNSLEAELKRGRKPRAIAPVSAARR
jgi:hypothetical protein